MKLTSKIFISLAAAITLVCCGVLLLLAWPAAGWKALTVQTGSMRPTIQPGSLVLVHSVPAATLKVGDVITYTNPRNIKETITHRITRTYMINNKVPAFVTKGDANAIADPPIVGGLVKGRAEAHVPYLGRAINWLKTWPGLIAIVYIPILAVVIEELRRLTTYYRSQQPYLAAGHRPSYVGSTSHSLRLAAVALFVPAAVVFVVAVPAHALLKSNIVTLGPNNLTVAAVMPANNCSGNTTNNTNINVTNTSTQTATTGSVSNTNNTTGGSATSGNAGNSNNTNININVNNCH